jgi:hypothetical protein
MPRAVQSAPRVVTRKILRKGSFVVQTLKVGLEKLSLD